MGENIFRLLDELTAVTKRVRRAAEDLVGTVTSSSELKVSGNGQMPVEMNTEPRIKESLGRAMVTMGGPGNSEIPSPLEVAAFDQRVRMAKLAKKAERKEARGPVSDARRMQGQWMSAVRVLSPENRELAKTKRVELGLGAAIEWAKAQPRAY